MRWRTSFLLNSRGGRIVVAAVAAGALACLVWLIVKGAEEAPAVIAAVVAASSAIAVAALGRYWTDSREATMRHRAEVAPIYEEFVERYFELMPKPWRGEKRARPEPGSPLSDQERDLADFTDRMTRKLLVSGSPTIVKAWVQYQETMRTLPVGGPDPVPGMVAFEDFLFALRRDVGHRDGHLARGDLLRTYLRDVNDTVDREQYPR
jgi:hypothetical protein